MWVLLVWLELKAPTLKSPSSSRSALYTICSNRLVTSESQLTLLKTLHRFQTLTKSSHLNSFFIRARRLVYGAVSSFPPYPALALLFSLPHERDACRYSHESVCSSCFTVFVHFMLPKKLCNPYSSFSSVIASWGGGNAGGLCRNLLYKIETDICTPVCTCTCMSQMCAETRSVSLFDTRVFCSTLKISNNLKISMQPCMQCSPRSR